MSWEPGRDTILGMLDRRELESVIASMDLATALLAQAEEAIDTARDAATSGRWYSAYANLWDGARKALSALLQAQGLRPTRTGGHVVVEHAAIAQFSGSMGAILRPVPRMRNTRNDTEYPTRILRSNPTSCSLTWTRLATSSRPAARSFRI